MNTTFNLYFGISFRSVILLIKYVLVLLIYVFMTFIAHIGDDLGNLIWAYTCSSVMFITGDTININTLLVQSMLHLLHHFGHYGIFLGLSL